MKDENIVVKHKINYQAKGCMLYKEVEISFISRWVETNYHRLKSDTFKIMDMAKELADMRMDMDCLRDSREDGWRDKAKSLKQEIKSFEKQVEDFGYSIVKNRMDLVAEILNSNEINDDDLKDNKFWDRKTSPGEMNSFLEAVCFKDYPKKKALKVQEAKTSSTKTD